MSVPREIKIKELRDEISELFYDKVDRDLPLLKYGTKEYVADHIHQMGDVFVYLSYKAMDTMNRTHNEEIFNRESKEYLYVAKYFTLEQYSTDQILQFIKESEQWDILERAISNETILFSGYAYLLNIHIEDVPYIADLILRRLETMEVY